jgi:hypothetical protein
MPTGYTADIAKGITFEQFIMGCARGFGACITMRDDPSDAEIPDEFKPSDYHDKELAKAKRRLAGLMALQPDVIEKRAAAAHKKALAAYRERIQRCQALHDAYSAMLDKARAWVAPTPDHCGLKDFMVDQITKSMQWDCNLEEKPPAAPSAEAWYAKEIQSAQWNVNYHEEGGEKERERCRERTQWVRQLRASL